MLLLLFNDWIVRGELKLVHNTRWWFWVVRCRGKCRGGEESFTCACGRIQFWNFLSVPNQKTVSTSSPASETQKRQHRKDIRRPTTGTPAGNEKACKGIGPLCIYADISTIEAGVGKMIKSFGKKGYLCWELWSWVLSLIWILHMWMSLSRAYKRKWTSNKPNINILFK